MKYLSGFVFLGFFVVGVCSMVFAEISFDFERNSQGWKIPDWALEQADCAGMFLEVAPEKASEQQRALKISCDFPGDAWTSAVVEYEQEMDLEGYGSIRADVFLPEDAKGGGYQARIILIAGSSWWWIEMKRPVYLEKGQWTKVEAKLDVNFANEKFFWLRQEGKDSGIISNRKSVKKIIIRVESEADSGFFSDTSYQGPIYIDNIVIS